MVRGWDSGRRTIRRLATVVLLSGLVVATAACGDDAGSASASTPAASEPTPMDPSTPGSLPVGGISTSLETLGYALDRAMGEQITGYDVDGSTLRINVDEPFDEFSMHCMIIEMTAGSLELPEGSQVQVIYNDGGVTDCDIS